MSPPAADRIQALDVLRALALFGIILTHAEMGFLAGRPPDPTFDIFTPLDAFVADFVRVFVNGKFFSIFSFLFGVSFAIQLGRSQQRQSSFAGRFAWRLTLLFAIGVIHQLFFNGDILTVYAVLGLLLLPLRNVSSRLLLVAAAIFMFNLPGIATGVLRFNGPPPSLEQRQASAAQAAAGLEAARKQLAIKQHGSLGEVVALNRAALKDKLPFQLATGRLSITFGCFLLGVCAWRARVFEDTERNRQLMRRVLAWCLPPAVLTTVVMYVYPTGMRLMRPDELWPFIALCVQQVTLAAIFFTGALLWYWRQPQGWLARLTPMGRMGLTVYLTQSVFGVFVFYGIGLGLLGRIGTASCVALGIGFFILQYVGARWWMQRFAQGPVEWLWRSATDRQWRSIGRPQTEPA